MSIVTGVLGKVSHEVSSAGCLCEVRRQRKILQEVLGDRVGNRCPLSERGHNRGRGNRIGLLQRFPTVEEERLVLTDGTADRRPILIAMEGVLGSAQLIGEEVSSLELVVTIELQKAAMKQVGPALGHNVDLRARLAAELYRRHGCDDAEFLDRFCDPEIGVCAVDLRVQGR